MIKTTGERKNISILGSLVTLFFLLFEQGVLHFHFVLSPVNCIASPVPFNVTCGHKATSNEGDIETHVDLLGTYC